MSWPTGEIVNYEVKKNDWDALEVMLLDKDGNQTGETIEIPPQDFLTILEAYQWTFTEMLVKAREVIESKNAFFEELKESHFGLSEKAYQNCLVYGHSDKKIQGMVEFFGLEAVEKGYYIGSHLNSANMATIPDCIYIEKVPDLLFEDYFDACRQAEKDGVRFINDIDGLEKGRYIDTPKNRDLCTRALQTWPHFSIQSWWKHANESFTKKYVAKFGMPFEKKGSLDSMILNEQKVVGKETKNAFKETEKASER